MDEKLELKDGTIWINQDIKKVLQELYDHYRSIQNRNEYLKNELERVKSDKFKDEELAKMKSAYEKMKAEYYRGFAISEDEDDLIKEWEKHMIEKYPANSGAIGGRFHYEFVPTGVGTVGTVVDSFTNQRYIFHSL